MQTSTFVKSVCAVYLVLTAGLTLGAGLWYRVPSTFYAAVNNMGDKRPLR